MLRLKILAPRAKTVFSKSGGGEAKVRVGDKGQNRIMHQASTEYPRKKSDRLITVNCENQNKQIISLSM